MIYGFNDDFLTLGQHDHTELVERPICKCI